MFPSVRQHRFNLILQWPLYARTKFLCAGVCCCCYCCCACCRRHSFRASAALPVRPSPSDELCLFQRGPSLSVGTGRLAHNRRAGVCSLLQRLLCVLTRAAGQLENAPCSLLLRAVLCCVSYVTFNTYHQYVRTSTTNRTGRKMYRTGRNMYVLPVVDLIPAAPSCTHPAGLPKPKVTPT